MMAMPICDSIVSDRLLVNTSGASSEHQGEQAPDQPAPDVERLEFVIARSWHQPSRVPSRPLGRKIRISTRNRYGRIGATCESVSFTQRVAERRGAERHARAARQRRRASSRTPTAKVWITPISSDARNAPGQRAHAADHHHHEDHRAHRGGHRRLGHEGAAADHAGQPGQRRAGAEHQHEHARHVVAQGLHRFGMRQRRLDHQADAGARQQQPDATPASAARPAS